ncbi:hypothetical protein BO70DRAFT_332423 [Aspergillus heteromorphus CBS 117.55]|uniref:Protein efr3 n=1 Tax=Aspergillus heteromorphus CBS 117.55 TaxID=1448321 RepID=A0A317WMB7_9EURO|nr:uncharacterized protein BO70DRAFT_332423 [Aspergillus heteromorphus CBS 117.55]PWY87509.1 hypothetical protein BO70DRAFT_332423 [Aspergillus heteromorphus CBS 117.55]
MEGVRQSCRPKHQVLVLKCYPQYQKGISDVKPNPSELSYLLYYASTRRSKLTKVGAFLEKRAARDVWRRKMGNVQVTLQILTALIEKVPRDLPIYARSVLTVIDTVLRSRDISLVEDSIATFEMFCRHQDMAALSAEQEFATQYREVVRTYASFADVHAQANPATSAPLAIRWRTAGLRAIKGVVSSEAGLAADGGDSLRLILPVILENLCQGDEDLLTSLENQLQESEKSNDTDPAHRRRVSTATVQTVDTVNGDPALASQSAADTDKKAEMDVRLLALRCLESIVVTGSSRGQIRVTTKVVLDFILRKSRTSSLGLSLDSGENWATSLIELVAKWCPVQVRFIILVAAMEHLFDTAPTEEGLDEHFTVVYMIDWLLKSSVNMMGLSVIDILLSLMQHMSSLLFPAGSEKPTEPSGKRNELLSLLQRCVGNLATHNYYGDQIVDMIKTILNRIKATSPQEHPTPAQADSPGSQNGSLSGETSSVAFSSAAGKVSALRAIKNVLLVANSRRQVAVAGVESRNPVGIHVWEGTQWLLQERQSNVRIAYANALLTWLNLETRQSDLIVKDKHAKLSSPKREAVEVSEKSGKRSGSGVHQRERAAFAAQSNFLRMLHLTIYDIALESPARVSEVRLLHLILTSLVEKLGINACRFGLPMVLKLQDDMDTSQSLVSVTAKVNIGSLVYGYLWALSERFDLETSSVGRGIQSEIMKRQKLGLWLEYIRLPAADLDHIIQGGESHAIADNSRDTDQMTPYKSDIEALVRGIEDVYNQAVVSAHSPPSSPGRILPLPPLGHGSASANPQRPNLLPVLVREQMLSGWSRESCLAAAEREKTEAVSLSGSRAGTLAMRGQFYLSGAEGSSPSTSSPTSAQQGAAGLHNSRRMSVPESSRPQPHSPRESPVHVNELRRVLSINDQEKMRRLSPLRGRLDASNRSVVSSSSESMVSGYSLSEVDGDGASIRHHSSRGGYMTPDGDVTPRASDGTMPYYMASEDIPPVPPIPPSLSIPGSMPNDSQRSLSTDRPSTAPGPRRLPAANGKPGTSGTPHHGKSLSKHKSRSSTGLAAAAADGDYSRGHMYDGSPETDNAQRRDVQELLNGFLSPAHAEMRNGTGRPRAAGRRGVSGGLGRPPY